VNEPATQEFLASCVTTAVEGGINYWVRDVVRYRWRDLPFPEAAIRFENEDGDGLVTRDLTEDLMREGVERIVNDRLKIAPHLAGMLIEAVARDDAGMVDADLADCIVQAGLFGELVYG